MTMNKIAGEVERLAGEHPLWGYGIVHALNPERAREYVERLSPIIGEDPKFVSGVSPVIGAHSGVGSLGIAVLEE